MNARSFELKSARFLAADCLRRFLLPGDIAVDATMGNGHDTQMLCELVGESGHVYAFDVQEQAVANTRARLEDAGLLGRATLFHCGHQEMAQHVPTSVQSVMFNLGWLPGGDKHVTTHWETTRTAILAALNLLCEGGVCVICAYPGHAAGDEERERLTMCLAALRPQDFNVLHQRFINAGPGAPECFILQKQTGAREITALEK